MSSEPAAIHTTETPLEANPTNEGVEETTRTEQVDEPVTQNLIGTTLPGVVQYASSNSSEESCGTYFNRQVALIEESRPPGSSSETAKTTKESVSEPVIVTRNPVPSPPPNENDKEAPTEGETTDSANRTATVLPPSPSPNENDKETPMEEETTDSSNRTPTVLLPNLSGHYEVSFLEAPATPTPQTSHIEILGSGDAEAIEATFKSRVLIDMTPWTRTVICILPAVL